MLSDEAAAAAHVLAPTCARAGAEWLDQRCPEWYHHVESQTLNLKFPVSCVLGQLSSQHLAPSFYTLEQLLDCSTTGGVLAAYGFTRPEFKTSEQDDAYWEALTAAWNHEINNRRARDVA